MKEITYECPRADCQKIFTIKTDSNCMIYWCPECLTRVNKNNIIEVVIC